MSRASAGLGLIAICLVFNLFWLVRFRKVYLVGIVLKNKPAAWILYLYNLLMLGAGLWLVLK